MRRLGLALALLLVLPVACTSDPVSAPRTTLPPVPADGIVSLPQLVRRPDLRDVDVGTESPGFRLGDAFWDGELVLVGGGRPTDERYVVTVQAGGPDLPDFAEVDPSNWQRLDVEGLPALYGYGGSPVGCSTRSLTVQASPTARLVVAGVTQRSIDELVAVARTLRLVGAHIETDRTDVRRLPATWLRTDGSRLTIGQRQRRYLVRRVDAAEQELLLAMRCPRGDRISPPASTSVDEMRPWGPARHHVAGRTVDVGLSGSLELAVVRGRHGVLVGTDVGCCDIDDPEQFAALAAGVGVVGRTELLRRDESARRRVMGTRLASLREDYGRDGAELVAHGSDGDLGWALARRAQRWAAGAVPPEVCYSSLSSLDGYDSSDFQTECIQEATVGPALVPAPSSTNPQVDHLWGAVGDRVATVVVERPGGAPRRVAPVPTEDPTVRRVFVVAFDPPLTTARFTTGDVLRRTTELRAGPVVLRALDADGKELAAVAVGKAGCPVPPGCAP
jgi:hypothetical protein